MIPVGIHPDVMHASERLANCPDIRKDSIISHERLTAGKADSVEMKRPHEFDESVNKIELDVSLDVGHKITRLFLPSQTEKTLSRARMANKYTGPRALSAGQASRGQVVQIWLRDMVESIFHTFMVGP